MQNDEKPGKPFDEVVMQIVYVFTATTTLRKTSGRGGGGDINIAGEGREGCLHKMMGTLSLCPLKLPRPLSKKKVCVSFDYIPRGIVPSGKYV